MSMHKTEVAPLNDKVIDKLLDLLSTDDAFRLLFVSDVKTALMHAGYEPPLLQMGTSTPVAGPEGCLRVTNLASKDQIRRDRSKLAAVFGVPFTHDCATGLIADSSAENRNRTERFLAKVA